MLVSTTRIELTHLMCTDLIVWHYMLCEIVYFASTTYNCLAEQRNRQYFIQKKRFGLQKQTWGQKILQLFQKINTKVNIVTKYEFSLQLITHYRKFDSLYLKPKMWLLVPQEQACSQHFNNLLKKIIKRLMQAYCTKKKMRVPLF